MGLPTVAALLSMGSTAAAAAVGQVAQRVIQKVPQAELWSEGKAAWTPSALLSQCARMSRRTGTPIFSGPDVYVLFKRQGNEKRTLSTRDCSDALIVSLAVQSQGKQSGFFFSFGSRDEVKKKKQKV